MRCRQQDELVTELIDDAHSPAHLFAFCDSYSGPTTVVLPFIGTIRFDLDEQSLIPA